MEVEFETLQDSSGKPAAAILSSKEGKMGTLMGVKEMQGLLLLLEQEAVSTSRK